MRGFISLNELERTNRENPVSYIIEGLLPADDVHVAVGDSGLGKTPWAYQLGLCVATARKAACGLSTILTFQEFASRWESLVLVQHKPSTQVTIRSHLRKRLVPFAGKCGRSGRKKCNGSFLYAKLSGKTPKNLFATIQMLWKSARVWGYVARDAVSELVLPKKPRVA